MFGYGIISLSVIAVRKKPDHRSEMVTQALFGELYKVLETTVEWTQIQLIQDNYIGWIPNIQVVEVDWESLTDKQIVKNHNTVLISKGNEIKIPFGSILWEKRDCELKLMPGLNPNESLKTIVEVALSFLNTPYLWGGKTLYGIDCSGLVQLSYLIAGLTLPRDAYLQAELGDEIELYECKEGDLAFFNNAEGKIIHVGIIVSNDGANVKIIHASGKVRVDVLNEKGILNQSTNIYSHQLTFLKRIALGKVGKFV